MREACNVIIIDPVGKKAGLDHYNDSLAKSLNKLDVLVRVYSNYKSEYSEPVFTELEELYRRGLDQRIQVNIIKGLQNFKTTKA